MAGTNVTTYIDISNKQKKFCNIDYGANVVNIFSLLVMLWANKVECLSMAYLKTLD
jgi:hypothetical protein